MFNNEPILNRLINDLDGPRMRRPPARRRVVSQPCLVERLPSSAFIWREAESNAPKAVIRQLRRSPSPPLSPPEEQSPRERRKSTGSVTSPTSPLSLFKKAAGPSKNVGRPWKDPQPFEVFRAIENKDLIYLMEIRDRAFHLLLRRTGDATPLVHAMRIGQSHREVAIVLLGAFSRWVNHLDDEEMVLPKTKVLLKALRTNLKLAIDYGLQTSQSDLTASFLQTLIMSEGDKWVYTQVSSVALALRTGNAAKPVNTAESAVRSFATKELGKAQAIAALEDYVANATGDLLMMGAWSVALDSIPGGEQIPSWYFARDDRVYKAFVDRLDQHRGALERSSSRRLRWQTRVLREVMRGRNTTYRSKVELLAGEFDEGDGI